MEYVGGSAGRLYNDPTTMLHAGRSNAYLFQPKSGLTKAASTQVMMLKKKENLLIASMTYNDL